MKVVNLEILNEETILIKMQDFQNKNMFTLDLIEGLQESFSQAKQMLACKSIILTGFENYFASGATQETLLELHGTSITFNTVNLYRLALDADVPVIAAMQGHSLGGGLIMGMFADIIVLGRESLYSANFMKYGFTPGMGATYILPYKLGNALGNEMLLTARGYRGEELKERGAPFQVVDRKKVLSEALKIASQLCKIPRHSLLLLKKHLNREILKNLEDIIQMELLMHKETIHHQDVKANILNHFGNLI